MFLPCPECRDEQIFEQPLCVDGHGPDCPEWMCQACGFGLFLATYPEIDVAPADRTVERGDGIGTARPRPPRGLRGLAPVPDPRRPAAALLSSVTAVPPYGGPVSERPPMDEADRFGAAGRGVRRVRHRRPSSLRAAMEGHRAELSFREPPARRNLLPVPLRCWHR